MSKLAIVIGVTAMDGESLVRFLLKKGYRVIGTYRRNTQVDPVKLGDLYNHDSNLSFEYCDISDGVSIRGMFERVIDSCGHPDEVYMVAAQSHVGKSFQSPESTVLVNGMSWFHVLEGIRILSPTTRIYFCGTSELLGGDPSKCPFTEESSYECRSPYAIGKELGTRWVKYFRQTHGLFACYGVLFNHSNTSRSKEFFIRKVTNAAARIVLGKQSKLKLGNIEFWRDEHWSDFGVEMMWKMLQLDEPETFLICRGECFHGTQFLDAAFGHFNLNWRKHVEIDQSLVRPNEVVKLVGDPAKAICKLEWRPNRIPFQDHIRLMCEYDYVLESGGKPVRPNVFALYP